ncbi:zinc finger and BTB domain-containing protein 5-like [Xyrichtys novacula]|uniref:Zinc finger and BTB domain-containing protein 5-like n=1 Tax=Xyrichtys novacula TaxID=13765 RepID=A0AAV1FAY2_XYRNO|nr:zinc finger and BTB domain-containing protein 5-like [Xyrichtys novacula]
MDFPGHFQHIFKQLNHQRLHAQLCDCLVAVGPQSFQAHRSILAACSSHFRALLSSSDNGDEVEGSGGGDKGEGVCVLTLDPEVVTPEAFSTLLDMIYTSNLSLRASNVMDVLLAASHLHLNAVVKACKLHLSRKNFPASPPKGWRSMQQQNPAYEKADLLKPCTSLLEKGEDEGEAGVEVSQSGGVEDQMMKGETSGEQSTAALVRHKRKSNEDCIGGRKRFCRVQEGNYKECSPTVTRSTVSTEDGGEELLSPSNRLWEGQSEEEEEVEEKYEATKGEMEEIQLPSQSDSSTGGIRVWERGRDGDTVLKVKVGDEGEEEGDNPKMPKIEVKRENLSSYSPDLDAITLASPPSPLQDCTKNLNTQLDDEKMDAACPAEVAVSPLNSQLCTDLHSDPQREAGDLGEASVDSEGLDSLSELAFSCFLNPSAESVMGSLEEDDSLASLTAAATAAATASDTSAAAEDTSQLCQNSKDANTSSAQSSDSSSPSFVFPVTSVPLQQLLPTQGPSFSDTLILQPTQNSLAGFLSGIRPSLGLDTSLVQPSRAGKSSGATTFRRIAPKVLPGSEAGTDSSPSDERPSLTRASDDVLSKCKKAAAEDHVLLVEGEKKYACKICCKTFMNLTDCKKHIRVHTGEKPYPCPKCGKRFSQSSHLYKHSKNTCLNWKDDQSFTDTLL